MAPEGVYVCGRRGRLAADLLRRRISRRHDPGAGPGDRRQILRAVEQLRDSEVDELHHTLFAHQDVAGLQVAMNHQVAVCELDRIAHGQEEPDAILDREPAWSLAYSSD